MAPWPAARAAFTAQTTTQERADLGGRTKSDGVLREVELRPASIPGGGMLVMLQDVTDERRSEEVLRAMEAKFRALVHENPLPIVLSF